MDPRERSTFSGYFWLPGEPEDRIAGVLTLDAGSPVLELYSSDDVTAEKLKRLKEHVDVPVMLGRSLGTCLTLLDCVEVGFRDTHTQGKYDRSRTVHVGTVLTGAAHVEDGRFSWATFRVRNLEQWLNRSPFDWDGDSAIRMQDLPVYNIQIPGAKMIISRDHGWHDRDLTAAGFRSNEIVEIHVEEPTDLEDLEYRFVRPMEQLITLASGTECKAVALRVGQRPAGGSGNWPTGSVEVRRRAAVQDQVTIREHMRFGLNRPAYPPDFNDPAGLIVKWYELQASLTIACDLIFSLRSSNGGYLQQQVFTAASAVEALHRRLHPELEKATAEDKARNKAILGVVKEHLDEHRDWLSRKLQNTHRKSYKFRINELISLTGDLMPGVVGDTAQWAEQLRAIRDGIGHVLPEMEQATPHQQAALLCSAQYLAEGVLLRCLDFSTAEVKQAMEREWNADGVRGLMKRGFPDWFLA